MIAVGIRQRMKTYGISRLPWPVKTPEHRWYGLGRYYAMFPAPFVTRAVNTFTKRGDVVMDPFCGRGNAPFMAAALGRPAIAVDIQPVAWLFTAAKLAPALQPGRVLARLRMVGKAVRPGDRKPQSRFEAMAWAPAVLGFLRAARRELDWKTSKVDRTLMAFVALHMQDSCAYGLSNRLSPTVAHSPSYAVRWWTRKGLLEPPGTDPIAFLTDRITRRYGHGTPALAHSSAFLGDARRKLATMRRRRVKLLITSPPYHGVTDYWNDHWIRLWLLGHRMRKDWGRTQKHATLTEYRALISEVLARAARHMREDGFVLVRCGDKAKTTETCIGAIRSAWPSMTILQKRTVVTRRGVASGYGHGAKWSRSWISSQRRWAMWTPHGGGWRLRLAIQLWRRYSEKRPHGV